MSRTGRVPLDELLAHREWVSRLAYHLAGGAGDDVAQDAWTAVLRSPPHSDRPAKPWLAEVVRNIVRRRWRDQERRGRREQAFGGQARGHVEALDLVYERMELQRMVAEEVMALDEQLRTVVVLRYVEEHDSAQIAALLGCAPGTVRWRLKLAVDQLRTRLDDRCRGNRQAWTAVLAPIASTRTTTTVTTGPLLMANAKLKTSILAALLVLLVAGVAGLATWRWQSRSGSSVASDKDDERRPRFKPAQLVPGAVTSVPAHAGSIAGIVRDEAERPVAGAVVVAAHVHVVGSRAPDSPLVPAHSTADGRFQLAGLRPAGYVVTATKLGLGAGRSSVVTVAPSQSVGEVVVTVAAARAELSGTVVDSGGGRIPRARVLAGLVDGSGRIVFGALTNDEGHYKLPLPKGDYVFEARAEGYAPARFSLFLHLPLVREFRLHPASRILGRVITRPGGTPLGDAEVWATAATGGTVRTHAGQDGVYMFSELEPGSYSLLARSGAFIGRRGTPLRVGLAQEASDVDIAIARGGTISGDVKDHLGAPMKNVDVLARSEPPARVATDALGVFRLEGVSLSVVDLAAWSERASARRRVDVTSGNADGVHLVLAPDARISGVVLDQAGKPVTGARVLAMTGELRPNPEAAASAFSDQQGTFAIERIAPGPLRVSAIHEGALAEVAAGLLEPGGHRHVELRLGQGASVEGIVRRQDGKPAEGALVFAFASVGGYGHSGRWPQPTVAASAAQDGVYRLTGVPAGDVILRAVSSGDDLRLSLGRQYRPDHVPMSLREGEKKAGVDLVVLKNDLKIRGRVIDAEGHAVAGAALQVLADGAGVPGAQTLSQQDGQFVIDGLSEGPYTIIAVHPDYSDGRLDQVAAGSSAVELRLKGPGSFAGIVIGEGGRPAGEYVIVGRPVLGADATEPELRRAWNSAPLRARVSKADGAFSFENVAPGDYELNAYLPDKRAATLSRIGLVPGEHKTGLRLVVGPGAAIRGRAVEYRTGRPIAGVRAEGRGTAYRLLAATANDNGVFLLEGLPAGGTVDFAIIPPRNDYLSDCQHRRMPDMGGIVDIGDVPMFPGSNQALGMRAQIATGLWFHSQESRPAVYSVAPGSAAERAGVRAGDLVIALNDTDIQKQSSSVAEGLLATGGQTIKLSLLSGTERRVHLIQRPDSNTGR